MRLIVTVVVVVAIILVLQACLIRVFKDDDLATAVFWMMATVVAMIRRRGTWPFGVFFSVCLLCAYLEHRLGNEHAHDVFHVLYSIGIAIYFFSDTINKWMKKLWGKIRSAGLTAINQASFKRQAKDAFS